MSLLFSWDGK